MDYKDFERLRHLLLDENQFEAWKKLQEIVLEKQLKIDFAKARAGEISNYFALRVLQRFVDSIFWIYVKFELSDVRRIYHSGIKVNSPAESNMALHKEKVDECHVTSEHFALYADLGTNIGVGDIIYLMANNSFFVPAEFKGGSVNEEIKVALEKKENGDSSLYDSLLANKKKSQQVRRFERQMERLQHQADLYQSNIAIGDAPKGFDEKGIFKIVTGSTTSIFEMELTSLLEEKHPDGWCSKTIDDCLDIFVIHGETGASNFELWAKDKEWDGVIKNFVSYNFNQTFSRPLMSYQFSTELIWKLLVGDITVLFQFSIERYLQRFSDGSIPYKKISGKRYRKIIQKLPGITRFPGDFVISLRDDENGEFYWTDAMYYRMCGCLETPASIHQLFNHAQKEQNFLLSILPEDSGN